MCKTKKEPKIITRLLLLVSCLEASFNSVAASLLAWSTAAAGGKKSDINTENPAKSNEIRPPLVGAFLPLEPYFSAP